LAIPRSEVAWLHPDFEEKINSLYAEHGDIEKRQESLRVEELPQSRQYEPIDCFNRALQIYTRQDFPEYWAMLQHNLGLAYADRIQGDRLENLEKSIECFISSIEIYIKDKFPEKWLVNNYDLMESLQALESLQKWSLVKEIINLSIPYRNLQGADLSNFYLGDVNLNMANLSGANLSNASLRNASLEGANLTGANLICANLTGANLTGANLTGANLTGANLTGANLTGANFSKADLRLVNLDEDIFSDVPGDRSESTTPVPR
jgi:hypothetical protein